MLAISCQIRNLTIAAGDTAVLWCESTYYFDHLKHVWTRRDEFNFFLNIM